MKEFSVIIICAVISFLCYKKMTKRSISKGRGRLVTILTGLTSSIFVFFITMIIGVGVFFPEAPKSKKLEQEAVATNLPRIQWTTSLATTDEINTLIHNDYKENPGLTKSILDDIASKKEGTAERTTAEGIYIKYGVSLKDYREANSIDKEGCYNATLDKIKEINENYKVLTSDWGVVSPGDNAEQERRARFNKLFGKKQAYLFKSLELCSYSNVENSISNRLDRPSPSMD
ncbi:hypothetical protein [Edwardsiella tarda]|uniref:hypothetical protein n=1 Tax=Edwardsiella tarda TaxID=636 RepID=UPI00351C54A4